jgi:hypothetical protein
MPTQTKTILPLALRTDFVQTSPAVDVPVGLLAARFRMESTEFLTPDLTCQFQMEETNNGTDWRFVAGQAPFLGGQLKNGQPVLPSMRVTFNDGATQIRGTVTTQGSWRWALVVDLET